MSRPSTSSKVRSSCREEYCPPPHGSASRTKSRLQDIPAHDPGCDHDHDVNHGTGTGTTMIPSTSGRTIYQGGLPNVSLPCASSHRARKDKGDRYIVKTSPGAGIPVRNKKSSGGSTPKSHLFSDLLRPPSPGSISVKKDTPSVKDSSCHRVSLWPSHLPPASHLVRKGRSNALVTATWASFQPNQYQIDMSRCQSG